jgi:hypothetical protein
VEPRDNGRIFATEVATEYRASYFEVMQQRLHVELWESGGASGLNTFVGLASVPLLEVVTGPFRQSLAVMPFGEEAPQRQVATVSFNIVFEEVWDFWVTFMDWKTGSLEKERDKALVLNPSLEVKIVSENSMQDSTTSETIQNTK